MCLLVRKEVNISVSRKGGHTTSMTHTSVTIQVNPESAPSTPSWMGEVAAVAQVLTHVSLLNAIQEHVQVARARFGQYDTMDFVVVLVGYALSGEATLQSFYERLAPFAEVFMALFGRHHLPSRSALSRFLAALDQGAVEALRTQFQEDLLQRTPPFPDPGASGWLVWQRCCAQRCPGRGSGLHRAQSRLCAPGSGLGPGRSGVPPRGGVYPPRKWSRPLPLRLPGRAPVRWWTSCAADCRQSSRHIHEPLHREKTRWPGLRIVRQQTSR